MEWHKNDELFKKELREGYRWQLIVAEYLKSHGLDAHVPILPFRKHISENYKFRDVPDIVCKKKIIEVKSRRLKFTNPNDYPYKTVHIDTTDGWDGKKHKPHAFVYVSTVTGHMMALSSTTHKSWTKITVHDRIRDIDVEFYECNIRLWKPINRLVEALSNMDE
jgi:hypothetical protein